MNNLENKLVAQDNGNQTAKAGNNMNEKKSVIEYLVENVVQRVKLKKNYIQKKENVSLTFEKIEIVEFESLKNEMFIGIQANFVDETGKVRHEYIYSHLEGYVKEKNLAELTMYQTLLELGQAVKGAF